MSLRHFLWFSALTVAGLFMVHRDALAGTPTTAGSTTQPARGVDVLRGVIDPYDPAAERMRFLSVAGVDNEIDAKEFAASKGRPDSFVRDFDNWEDMLAYDKDGSKTLDWPEADAYRQALRNRVLSVFDTNKNGRLDGDETALAQAALLSGKLGTGPAVATATGPGSQPIAMVRPAVRVDMKATMDASLAQWRRQQAEMIAKYDKDGDGKLSPEEQAAMSKDQADQRKAAILAKWDTNGDGNLDRQERKAMREDQWRQGQEKMYQWELKVYDLDHDGMITDEERKTVQEQQRQARAKTVLDWELPIYDTNHDGKIDEEERAVVQRVRAAQKNAQEKSLQASREFNGLFGVLNDKMTSDQYRAIGEFARQQWEAQRKEELRKYDTDGDGKISAEERKVQVRDQMEQARAAQKEMLDKYDRNHDGTLDAAESMETQADSWAQSVERTHKLRQALLRKYSKAGDGDLSADEREAMMTELLEQADQREDADDGTGSGRGLW